MLPFCEPGDEYTIPWIGGGFSRCFLQIVGSMSSAGLLYLLGLSAIVLAPKPKKELKASEGESDRSTGAMFSRARARAQLEKRDK